MARPESIPPELQSEILRRAATGESTRAIARWLGEAHGLDITYRAVARFLARHRGQPAPPDSVTPEGPTPARRDREIAKRPHAICGARTRNGGRCKQPAGSRTKHRGEGRCWLHGGRSPGAPRGNKRAVTTGEYETIYADALEDGEGRLWDSVAAASLEALDEEIRTLKIRVRRMLMRVKVLKTRGELDGGKVFVEQSDWSTVTDQLRDTHGRFTPDMPDTEEPEQVSASRRRTMRSLDEALRLQEEAITRVQGRLLNAIRLRHVITKESGPVDERDILSEIGAALANLEAPDDMDELPGPGEP